MLFWWYNSLRSNNSGEMCVSMLIIAHNITNMKRHIRTDYKNIHFYDDNRKIINKREEKDHKGPASCTAGIEFLNNIRGFWYFWYIHLYIKEIVIRIFVVIYNEYHIYIPTNKMIHDIIQYKFQSITCTFYTMII